MSRSDILTLLPLLVMAGSTLVIMLLIGVRRNHRSVAIASLSGFILSLISIFRVNSLIPRNISSVFMIDQFALFFIGLMSVSGIMIVLISYRYLENQTLNREEYYLLLFTATLGSSVLVIAQHFVTLFLGLEILSVSLYTLISYTRNSQLSIESGIKYLILAAVSSAFMLFGMALIYAQTGVMDFPGIASRLARSGISELLPFAGFSLLLVGVGFKLAVVPFHMWTPDVYEGAPAPVTGFVATVSKGGMFALLLRFFIMTDGYQYQNLMLVFTIIAIASMFTGNLLALMQKNVKRILAYSSIAHLGYLLVALLGGARMGVEAAAFYLVAYFITTLGAFGIVTVLSGEEREADSIEDYRGLFWRRPWLATVFSSMLFSLAGIPLTAGFIGKFYVVVTGVGAALWLLVISLVLNSAIGLYYYLRIIVSMYSQPDEATVAKLRITRTYSLTGGIALAALTILLFWFGIFPEGIMGIIKTAAAGLKYGVMISHSPMF